VTVPSHAVTLPTVDDTLALGRALGALLRAGDLVILDGALGAGKTALTKGIAAGMGVSGVVMSPTFVLARVHRPDDQHPSSVPLVHVDAYRLSGAVELDDLDLDTDLHRSAVVVEWGAGVADGLAADRLTVEIAREADDSRTVRLLPRGGDWADRVAAAVSAVSAGAGGRDGGTAHAGCAANPLAPPGRAER
jgi:tRNA threonylcarbamoyladenosine biosynthesis protein TsaE